MTGGRQSFWSAIDGFSECRGARHIDEHHAFGPRDELIVDRSRSAPAADSRLVHFDPDTESYIIVTPERIRFNSLDGVTVFQDTSPWDTQNRQDPLVNFHVIAQTPVNPATQKALGARWTDLIRSGGAQRVGQLFFLREDIGRQKDLERARGIRGAILYPRTELMDEALLRSITVFSPRGSAFFIRDIHIGDRPDDVIRVGLRLALLGDELFFTIGAANRSRRPVRVSLISFLMPLLTRGFSFNAESPWLHEGHAVPGRGFLIRSGEEHISCAIRRASSASERWDNVSSIAYHGGMDRGAAFPDALSKGETLHRSHTAGFVAPACAHTQDRKILKPGETFEVDLAVRVFTRAREARAHLEKPLTVTETEHAIHAAEGRAATLINRSAFTCPNPALTSFFVWIKQQVSGGARIKTRFRLFWNYLLGIRDKSQAAYAAVDFDPATARAIVLEVTGQQFEDGRFPRQYSFDGTYDLRYFMDSGLWIPSMLVPHYLKCTGDFSLLLRRAGYKKLEDWNPATKTGRVIDSRRVSTVLDHLIENVEHVIRNRDLKTGMVNIRDGDWNDAIGLIQHSVMVLEQLYMALDCMADLAAHLPGRIRSSRAGKRLARTIPAWRRLMDDLHDIFLKEGILRDGQSGARILHGYTREGRTVGGFWDSDAVAGTNELKATFGGTVPRGIARWVEPFRDAEGNTLYKLHRRWAGRDCRKIQTLPDPLKRLFLVDRISSTPLSFALLSGILRHRESRLAPELEDVIARDAARLDSKYGFKTFTTPFNKSSRELGIGRIGNLDGAENASPYIHAGMFLCMGLYRIGRARLAGEFLEKTLPVNRALHAGHNRAVQYMPNSWGIGANNDGASMNDFHTNAASMFERILVDEIVGLGVGYRGIDIHPPERLPDVVRGSNRHGAVTYQTALRGRTIHIVHVWKRSAARRRILLNGIDRPLALEEPRNIWTARIPWTSLAARSANLIQIIDPMPPP